MTIFHPKLAELVRRDPRYAYEAYEFVFQALAHTQKMLGRVPRDAPTPQNAPSYHVRGPELLAGVRDLALQEFGLMARTVFHLWGIERTDDIGEIVFNLVEANLMSKTNEDSRNDFRGIYDLDKALVEEFRIQLHEAEQRMTFAKLRLVVVVALFLAWIGFLVYQVTVHIHPQIDWGDFRVVKHPTVVLSRAQFLGPVDQDAVSGPSLRLDVSADVKHLDSQVPVEDVHVLWREDALKNEAIPTSIRIENLSECKGWDGKDWHGSERSLIPLLVSKDKDQKLHFRVAPLGVSPGFPPSSPRRYPDTRETRRELQQIRGLSALPE